MPLSIGWNDADGVVDKNDNAKFGFVDSVLQGLTSLGDAHLWQNK